MGQAPAIPIHHQPHRHPSRCPRQNGRIVDVRAAAHLPPAHRHPSFSLQIFLEPNKTEP